MTTLDSGINLILRVSLRTDRKDHLRNYCAYNLPPELNSLGAAQVHPTPFASPRLTNLVFDYPSDHLIFLSCPQPMEDLVGSKSDEQVLPRCSLNTPRPPCYSQLLCCSHKGQSGTSEVQCFLSFLYPTVSWWKKERALESDRHV